ncbi:hypothetical protein [Levilactobacillus brevis]|uniref:hypothetical protein n=1 Tax=Levilactobacillus brevis TaxID=1580 RepID=UPI000B3543D9|nr:hypothetical protein [Levilactobacillus brevis]
MKSAYEIYPDKVRVYTTGIIFILFGISLFGVIFGTAGLILKVIASLFGLLFWYAGGQTLRSAHRRQPDYVIDERGVTDNTQDLVVVVPWSDILKIEMTPNNAVMQIGILARKTVTNQDEKTLVLKRNLVSNGNMAFYSVMIDGFKFRQKQFLNIFEELQRQGVQHNPTILVNKYLPDLKLKCNT